jgi:CHASE3 domain sensor protein
MKTTLPLIRTTSWGFAAVGAILLLVGIVAYRCTVASTMSARWAQHTNEVLEHLANQRLSVHTLESGYRDFALSGADTYLQVSRDSVSFLDREDRALRALMADNSAQRHRLNLVTDLVERMVKRGDTLAQLRRTDAPEAAAEVIYKGQADPLQEEFRVLARDMQDEEHRLLHERTAEVIARQSGWEDRVNQDGKGSRGLRIML